MRTFGERDLERNGGVRAGGAVECVCEEGERDEGEVGEERTGGGVGGEEVAVEGEETCPQAIDVVPQCHG